MSRKLTLLALLVCAAVTGFVLWGQRDDPGARTSRRESVAEPEPQGLHTVPEPEPEAEPLDVGAEAEPEPAATTPAAESTAPAHDGGLLVRIVDPTGRPLTGAAVRLIGPDENGKWGTLARKDLPGETEAAWDGLRPGRMTLQVTRGDLTRSRPVKIPPGGRLEVSVPMPDGATVTGIVRHTERGPLAGVTLEGSSTDGLYRDTLITTTDDHGRYRLRTVPPGRQWLKITGKSVGYEQHPRAVLDVPGLCAYERDIVLGAIALRGIVRDAASGGPIPGVLIQIQEPYYVSCSSGDDGTYVFRDLAPGTLRLALSRDGYETRFFRDVALVAGEARVLDLELVAAAVLHVHFTDGRGHPVAGSFLLGINRVGERRSTGTSIQAGPDGTATYKRISPGKYHLSFTTDGYEGANVEKTIEPGENSVDVVVAPVPGAEPVSLQGVVRNAVSGDPLPGVSVRLPRGNKAAVSDRTGTYRLRGLPPGPYRLFVSRDGYGFHVEKDVVVKEGEPTTRDLELQPAAVLHLRVTTADGRPAVGRVVFGVFALDEKGTRIGTSVTVDGQGEATYQQILPGRYKLTVTREGLRAGVETEIRPGENRLEFQLK